MALIDKIKKFFRKLYPNGRAWKMPLGGEFEKINNGLAKSYERLYNDAIAVFDSILADNNNFTADDATDWERRLGIVVDSGATLADRKLAISRKYRHPGTIKARLHYLYMEGQLRDAGFDVYVHENIPEVNPNTYAGWGSSNLTSMGSFQLGQFGMGSTIGSGIIANHIDEVLDDQFVIGGNFRSIFIVGGMTKGTSANVPIERKNEFRQLILKLKRQSKVGYLFINYV